MINIFDTIGLISPPISEEKAKLIERECIRREGIDCRTGEIIYRFTTGKLKGSYDSRLRIAIERKKWVKGERDSVPVLVECSPYIHLEGSIHKMLMGHNVYGGPESFRESALYLIDMVEKELNVDMPDRDFWQVVRVDYADVFAIGFENIENFMRGMNLCVYPRRKVFRYGTESLFAPGGTTSLRIYNKGIEFYKHDRKRLSRFMKEEKLFDLQCIANELLRIEVEIKKKKLMYDFKGYLPFIDDITYEYCYDVYKREVGRILYESKYECETVRTVDQVEERLYKLYEKGLANVLLGTWYRLIIKGEEEVRKDMPKSTFYRHRKKLIEAGVSWVGSDVAIVDSKCRFLDDFKPFRDHFSCVIGESETVKEKLSKYRKVA